MKTAPIPPTGCNTKQLSASGLVKTGDGALHFIKVSSSTGGSIKLWDNTSAATTVLLDTMAVAAGDEHYLPFAFTTGLYCTITGTASLTVAYI